MQKLNWSRSTRSFLKEASLSALVASTLVTGILIAASTEATASAPIQLSLVPDIAIHDRTTFIEGISIGIWSENPQRALALGIVNGSTGQSTGFSWAYLLNYSDSYKGVQWAPVNYAQGEFLGWQAGIVSYSENSMHGLQTGLINYAGNLKGLQLGFLNYAEQVDKGVQIGFINLMPKNEWFTALPGELAPAMVFLNWHF